MMMAMKSLKPRTRQDVKEEKNGPGNRSDRWDLIRARAHGSSATPFSATPRSISNDGAIVKARNFALEIFANGEEV